METWLNEWEANYHTICELMKHGKFESVSHMLAQLELQSAKLLDQWVVLDEKLAVAKEKLNEAGMGAEKSFYQSLGTDYFAQNQMQRAVIALSFEKATGDQEEWRRLFLAYAYLMEGYHDETIEQFLYLIQTARHLGVRHFCYAGLGCYYTINGNVDRGVEFFEQAKTLTPTSDVVYNLGVCYYLTGAFEVSAEHFEQYSQHVKNDTEALRFFGLIQMKLNKADRAKQLWQQALSLYSSNEDVTRLALLCEWYGEHDLAIHCYQKALSLGENRLFAEHGLAWNLALCGHRASSWSIFNRLLKEQPDNPHIKRSLYYLGCLYKDHHSS
ncbi:tetratricopeptide repeat protein [Alkalicoccobacillus porphyridii]|uniref:Tetratricopeptide repeat protein n=1 Tax=Alkalicoccobacillus porphyridii TaxID=2597270 RepID=A0A553ZZS1_9BACI|nr:hypothetical protein [Alkalicoccobacillus porphyridii]TSB46944.1 hypothetical protein FN960_07955 [Alkalicoccobacillus porphyridii]